MTTQARILGGRPGGGQWTGRVHSEPAPPGFASTTTAALGEADLTDRLLDLGVVRTTEAVAWAMYRASVLARFFAARRGPVDPGSLTEFDRMRLRADLHIPGAQDVDLVEALGCADRCDHCGRYTVSGVYDIEQLTNMGSSQAPVFCGQPCRDNASESDGQSRLGH